MISDKVTANNLSRELIKSLESKALLKQIDVDNLSSLIGTQQYELNVLLKLKALNHRKFSEYKRYVSINKFTTDQYRLFNQFNILLDDELEINNMTNSFLISK